MAKLSDDQKLNTIRAALELARDKYDENARVLKSFGHESDEASRETLRSLAKQFEVQAKACRDVLRDLEEDEAG